jgi:hypothetical protein
MLDNGYAQDADVAVVSEADAHGAQSAISFMPSRSSAMDSSTEHPLLAENLVFSSRRAQLLSRGLTESEVRQNLSHYLRQHLENMDRKCGSPSMSPLQTPSFNWLSESLHVCRQSSTRDPRSIEFLRMFPHFPLMQDALSRVYALAGRPENAVRMSNMSLDSIILMSHHNLLFTASDAGYVLTHWIHLRGLLEVCGSLTKAGRMKWCEDKSASLLSMYLADWTAVEEMLFKRIQKDISTMQSSRLVRFGNILFAYLAFFIVLFLCARCFSTSSCSATVPQLVRVHRTSFVDAYPEFSMISVYPRCASPCSNSTLCVCPSQYLSCASTDPLVGTYCTCTQELICDACGICGRLRYLLRSHVVILFFASTFLDVILLVIALFAVIYPFPTLDGDPDVDAKFFDQRLNQVKDVGVLIAHHGGVGPLEATLKAALEIFPPNRIYVCHNGSSDAPSDQGMSLQLTRDVSAWYRQQTGDTSARDINYAWVGVGNKTLAWYQIARHVCGEKFLLVMDNDCELPKDLLIPVHWLEADYKAVAFTIRAQNTQRADSSSNILTVLQDFEYKKTGVFKLLQSMMGSALNAHGCASLWERDTFFGVLMKHNTMFHREDLQMGFLLHSRGEHECMACVANSSIPTRTPSHFICFPFQTQLATHSGFGTVARLLISPFKCTEWGCRHAEKSLFVQRVRSWDAAVHRMFFQLLGLLVFHWERPVLGLKVFLLHDCLSIVQDYLRFPLLVYIALLASSGLQVTFLWMLSITYLFRTLLHVLLDLWTFRKRSDLQNGVFYAVIFPVYGVLLILLRTMGMIYNLFVFVPLWSSPAKIKNVPFLPAVLKGEFISTVFDCEPMYPTQQDAGRIAGRPSISALSEEHLRGCFRTHFGWTVCLWNSRLGIWDRVNDVYDTEPTNVPRTATSRLNFQDESRLAVLNGMFVCFLIICAIISGLYMSSTTSGVGMTSSFTVIGLLSLLVFGAVQLSSIVW